MCVFAYVVCCMKVWFAVLCFEVERYFSCSLMIVLFWCYIGVSLQKGADIGNMYGVHSVRGLAQVPHPCLAVRVR